MDDFLEMIAAGEPAHVAAAHRARDVAAEQHRRDQLADLVDVVALLPPADLAPRDLGRRVERVERVGGDAAPAELMRRDAEVAELQPLALADEDVERREIAVQRLPAVQRVEAPRMAAISRRTKRSGCAPLLRRATRRGRRARRTPWPGSSACAARRRSAKRSKTRSARGSRIEQLRRSTPRAATPVMRSLILTQTCGGKRPRRRPAWRGRPRRIRPCRSAGPGDRCDPSRRSTPRRAPDGRVP